MNTTATNSDVRAVPKIRQLAEIGRRGEILDLLAGGDVDPDTGKLLSIAQLQEFLRAGNHTTQTPTPTPTPRPLSDRSKHTGRPDHAQHHSHSQTDLSMAGFAQTDSHDRLPGPAVTTATPPRWLLVIGAHAGAGSSTTALAIADSAALAGTTVHLIEAAQSRNPAGAGLAAATHHELGLVAGGWRRGRRGQATIDRPTTAEPFAWPPPPLPQHDDARETPVTILDAGTWTHAAATGESPMKSWWAPWGAAPAGVVVVCRASAPGVTSAERTLNHLHDRLGDATGLALPVVVAAVGGHRWRGPVKAAAGPALSRLQEQHLVVGVPHLRHLEIAGPTADALPRALTAAGRSLLTLATPSAPTPEGGQR